MFLSARLHRPLYEPMAESKDGSSEEGPSPNRTSSSSETPEFDSENQGDYIERLNEVVERKAVLRALQELVVRDLSNEVDTLESFLPEPVFALREELKDEYSKLTSSLSESIGPRAREESDLLHSLVSDMTSVRKGDVVAFEGHWYGWKELRGEVDEMHPINLRDEDRRRKAMYSSKLPGVVWEAKGGRRLDGQAPVLLGPLAGFHDRRARQRTP